MKKQAIALIDCVNFYAECEKVFNPVLHQFPVVILSNNDGCAVALDQNAKKAGLKRTAPIFMLKGLIKKYNVQVLSSNYQLYGDMSRRVMDILDHFSPQVEVYSIDEAFMDLSGIDEDYTLYSRKMVDQVKQWTGLPIRVGVGATKVLAKIASYVAKHNPESNNICNLTNNPNIDHILSQVDVSEIWGIGRSYTKLLKENGINTALDFKNADDVFIRKRMTIVGLKLLWEIRGINCIDLETMVPAKKQIVCSNSFGKEITEKQDLLQAVSYFTRKAVEKLRKQNSLTSVMTIFLKTNRFKPQDPQYSNSITITLPKPTDYLPQLIHCARKGLKGIFKENFKYKKAGLIMVDIVPKNQSQLDMFISEDPKEQKVLETLESINKRFGRNTIVPLSEGTKKNWWMNQQHLSPRYTTNWNEILTVLA